MSSDGAKPVRFEQLCDIIDVAEFGIHDLSRTQSDKNGRPRFNMPFELGLYLGAKRYGSKGHSKKRTLVLVREKNVLGTYLSDLAGIDPVAHHDKPDDVIRSVRNAINQWVATTKITSKKLPKRVPGPEFIVASFVAFKSALPAISAAHGYDAKSFNVLDAHIDFCRAVEEFIASLSERAGR